MNFELLMSSDTLNPEIMAKRDEVIVYGCGDLGCKYLELLLREGIKPLALCDANPELHGVTIRDIPVVSPEQLSELPKTALVCVTPAFHALQITAMLDQYGFSNYVYSICGAIAVETSEKCRQRADEYRQMIEANKVKTDYVYSKLNDDKSKKIFEAIIEYTVSGHGERLERFYEADQYFAKDIVEVGDNEVFVDCGAYLGETAIAIANRTNGRYKHIYSFEPYEICYYGAKSVIHTHRIRDVSLFKLGLSDRRGEARFAALGFADSNINENGTVLIAVDTLDNLLFDKDNVTFIKMDIEGSEMKALIGAEKLIRRDAPKLAISLYHKPDDFYEIPYFLMNAYPDYDYYVRLHMSVTEIVLYAIPRRN